MIVRLNPCVKYPVCEIFDSIQGEGTWMGIPATFIRLSGCNLRCPWCDTKDSWELGGEMEEEEILAQIHYPHVIITGGEPTLYDLRPLCTQIHQLTKFTRSIKIAIETNGTRPISAGDNTVDWVVCSPKPGAEFQISCTPNELKYVVDRDFNHKVIPPEWIGKIPIWLQPNNADFGYSLKKSYHLAMSNSGLRVGAQLHILYHLK